MPSEGHIRFINLSLGNCKRPIRTVRRDRSIRSPDIDEILHGLEIPIANQAKEFANADEIAERGVQVHVVGAVDVPERVQEMGVVEVGVDSEHLTPGSAHVAQE